MTTQAAKRYVRRFIPICVAYCALIAANTFVTHVFDAPPVIAGLMAVLATLPLIGMIVVMGMYLREETDEFVRDRHIFAMMIATGVLLSVASLIGMLQFAQLVGHIPVFLAFPLWCVVWGVTQGLMSRRDRDADDVA